VPLDDASVPIPRPNEAFVDRNRYITSTWYPWMVRLFKTLKTTVNALDTVQEDVDQINGTWTLSINSNDRVTGYVKLDGSDVSTVFAVMASVFKIIHPTNNGEITPFVTGLVNGVSTIGMTGNVIVDGTIATRHLVANSVSTDKLEAGAVTATKIDAGAVTATKIAAGAVTASKIVAGTITANEIAINGLTGEVERSVVFNSAISTTSTSFVAMPGMALTVTVGSNEKLLVTFTCSTTLQTRPGVFRLYLDGSLVTQAPQVSYPFAYIGPDFLPSVAPTATFTVILNPTAGTHTLRIYWANGIGGTSPPVYSHYRYFAALRLLK
jgi:hypothetical protein